MEIPVDRRTRQILTFLVAGGLIAVALLTVKTNAQTPAPPNPRAFFDTYCITCHDEEARTAGLALDTLDVTKPAANAEILEKVIGKLRAGSMPPPGNPRPDAATYRAVATTLENEIDQAWAAHPNPGRIGAVQRLNRAEYNNAIRDLFALDLDVKPLLPGDDTADGSFDNFADVPLHFDRAPGALHVGGPPGHAARDRPASRPARHSNASRSRCMCCKKTGRARICPSGRAAASRFTTIFRSTASTSSRSACRGNIRITSKAWDGRSSSTSAWMASC